MLHDNVRSSDFDPGGLWLVSMVLKTVSSSLECWISCIEGRWKEKMKEIEGDRSGVQMTCTLSMYFNDLHVSFLRHKVTMRKVGV